MPPTTSLNLLQRVRHDGGGPPTDSKFAALVEMRVRSKPKLNPCDPFPHVYIENVRKIYKWHDESSGPAHDCVVVHYEWGSNLPNSSPTSIRFKGHPWPVLGAIMAS